MRFIQKLFIALCVISMAGCAKTEEFNNTDTKVGISRVTFFPVLEMTGQEVMSVVKGTAFTDPGIKATEGGAEIPVTTTGSVNTNEVGFYKLSYAATNKDGFPASMQRIVVVIPEAEKPGIDLSGTYSPIGGAPANAVVTKLDKGLYYMTNVWGGGSQAVIPAYFISTNGTTLSIPVQDLGTGAGRIVTQNPGTYVNGLITWTVARLDFAGTPSPLILEKKWQKL